MAPDRRMYNVSKKGELFELKEALNATEPRERKNAVKRVIASMTLGKDVSSLFPHVIKNAMTNNFTMKKLVYLYIINYARSNPDLVILVINTFVKDASDPNPLVRALSLRTMALLRMEKVTDYIVEPLHKALHDEDPYVRKTAAVCVAKLFDSNPKMVKEEGFIPMLQDLLSDSNPMTVSNAVAALAEIAEVSQTPSLLVLNPTTVPRFLSALSDCTEWGQVFLLDAVSAYTPHDAEEAQLMTERIIPRLQHANAAVVLSAIKIIVSLMPLLATEDQRNFVIGKLRAPAITLLSTPPEMKYAALRNLNLLVRKHPTLFQNDTKVFFASYTEALCVKLEKLDILAIIADDTNVRLILSELKEYALDVDVTFSRKSIATVCCIALKLPGSADACMAVLNQLLESNTSHVVEEVAVGLTSLLRAYPGRYDSVVPLLCQSSELMNDVAAREALVWIVGEHAVGITEAPAMLKVFLETFSEEVPSVQIQVIVSCVKAFLVRAAECQSHVQRVLSMAIHETDVVDVRERAIMYARMLTASVPATQEIVMAPKPNVQSATLEMNLKLLDKLIQNLGSVASVYHQEADRFQGVIERTQQSPVSPAEEDLLGLESVSTPPGATEVAPVPALPPASQGGGFDLDDLLGIGAASASNRSVTQPKIELVHASGSQYSASGLLDDVTGPRAPTNLKLLLPAAKGKGLVVYGHLIQKPGGRFVLEFRLENVSNVSMTDFAIQLNKNAFGFVPVEVTMDVPAPLTAGGQTICDVELKLDGEPDIEKGIVLQIAIKFGPNNTIVYFAERLVDTLDAVLVEDGGRMDKPTYLSTWASISDAQEVAHDIEAVSTFDLSDSGLVTTRLEAARLFVVARRTVLGRAILYFSARVVGALHCMIMAELSLPTAKGSSARLAARSPVGGIAKPFLDTLGLTCQRLFR